MSMHRSIPQHEQSAAKHIQVALVYDDARIVISNKWNQTVAFVHFIVRIPVTEGRYVDELKEDMTILDQDSAARRYKARDDESLQSTEYMPSFRRRHDKASSLTILRH